MVSHKTKVVHLGVVYLGIVVAGMLINSFGFCSVSVRLKLLFLQLFRVVVLCFCSRPVATTSKPPLTNTHRSLGEPVGL